MESGGSTDPHFFKQGVKVYVWPPLLTCTRHVFCRIWVTITNHQRHSLRPLRAQNWYVYVLQSLYQAPQQNDRSSPSEDWKRSPNQQWTQAVSLIWHCYTSTKIVLTKLTLTICQTFVSSRPNECRDISSANRWHYLNVRSIVCGLFSVQCITVNLYSESFPLCNFREPFVTKSLGQLQFAWNQNKVQFCPKMSHLGHKMSKIFRGNTPNPCCWKGTQILVAVRETSSVPTPSMASDCVRRVQTPIWPPHSETVLSINVINISSFNKVK